MLILDKLITLTIEEVKMYPSVQAKIWGNIGNYQSPVLLAHTISPSYPPIFYLPFSLNSLSLSHSLYHPIFYSLSHPRTSLNHALNLSVTKITLSITHCHTHPLNSVTHSLICSFNRSLNDSPYTASQHILSIASFYFALVSC